MKKFLTGTAIFAGMAMLLATPAAAVPLNTTFTVTLTNGPNGSSGSSTDATQQALPSAAAAIVAAGRGNGSKAATQDTFTYTGALNLFVNTQATNTVGNFFASGGGINNASAATKGLVLSTDHYATETLLEFTFTTATAIAGTITHDDGISLFLAGSSTNLLPGNSSPTSAVSTSYSIAAGTYNLYYTEANGAPSDLTFDVASRATVPEPASMALLGAGLFGVGMLRRKRQA